MTDAHGVRFMLTLDLWRTLQETVNPRGVMMTHTTVARVSGYLRH